MPKKLRKSRIKRKTRSSRKPLAVKEVSQRRQSLPTLAKQAPVAKSLVTRAELVDRYRYVLWDTRRIVTIGGPLLLLLIVLSFFLR